MDHCRFKPEVGGFNKLNDGSGFVLAGGFNPNGKVNHSQPIRNGHRWIHQSVFVFFFLWDHHWTHSVVLGIVYFTAMAHIILITITISMPRPNDYPGLSQYIMTISLPISNSHIAINMSHVSWLIFFVGWFAAWSISHVADGRIWFLTHTGAVYVVFKTRCHSILLMVVRPPY